MACGWTALPLARLSCHPDGAWRGWISGTMPLKIVVACTAFNYFEKISATRRLACWGRAPTDTGTVIVHYNGTGNFPAPYNLCSAKFFLHGKNVFFRDNVNVGSGRKEAIQFNIHAHLAVVVNAAVIVLPAPTVLDNHRRLAGKSHSRPFVLKLHLLAEPFPLRVNAFSSMPAFDSARNGEFHVSGKFFKSCPKYIPFFNVIAVPGFDGSAVRLFRRARPLRRSNPLLLSFPERLSLPVNGGRLCIRSLPERDPPLSNGTGRSCI